MIELMHGMGVDTLKAAKALEKAGFESAQAEALVAAFGGSAAGGAATREDLRDLRNATREEIGDLRSEMRTGFDAVREEIAELRGETRSEFAAMREETRSEFAAVREETRSEFAAVREEIAGLREETRSEFAAVREETRSEFAAVREEIGVVKAGIGDLRTEIVKVRSACHNDIKSLKAQMYGLLLAQATLIVSLIVGLQRLL